MKVGTPFFLSIDGGDGAGKTSHLSAIVETLKSLGHEVVQTREPGGTPLAEKIRGLMLHDDMDPTTEAMLAFAARRDHLVRVIEPALAAGKVVVSDRFSDASFAFQGWGRNFDLGHMHTLEKMAQTGAGTNPTLFRKPDLTFWFDVSPEIAKARLLGARVPDRFEAQNYQFFTAVRNGYASRMQEDPDRIVRINADLTPNEVWQQVEESLHEKLQKMAAKTAHPKP